MKNINNITGKVIPLTELSTQYRQIEDSIKAAIENVLLSNRYILGEQVRKFESRLADFIGTKYVVGVGSGTDALTLAIKALGLKQGDSVVMPANVYPTAFGLALSGVKLQLADVDKSTLNITLDTIKKSIDQTTKAIVVVHLYGNPVDLEGIISFAKKNNIYLIEDCAQAIGAVYKGQKVGSFGDISCFSFYPTKNLGAYGDGGAIATNNQDIYELVKKLRMYGEEERYKSVLIGYNSRLDELQAAILNVKLDFLEDWNQKRRKIAQIYNENLKDLPVEIVKTNELGQAVNHLYVIKVESRADLMQYLNKKGITTGIHYPVCVHMTPAFKDLGYKKGDFPISEKASKEIISLPIYPEILEEDIEYVIYSIKDYFTS